MMKAGSAKKRPSPSAPAAADRNDHPYYGTRPTGSASFKLVRELDEWHTNGQQGTPPYSIVTVKMDGFQVVVDYSLGTVVLHSKKGIEYRSMKPANFKSLDVHMRKRFKPISRLLWS